MSSLVPFLKFILPLAFTSLLTVLLPSRVEATPLYIPLSATELPPEEAERLHLSRLETSPAYKHSWERHARRRASPTPANDGGATGTNGTVPLTEWLHNRRIYANVSVGTPAQTIPVGFDLWRQTSSSWTPTSQSISAPPAQTTALL